MLDRDRALRSDWLIGLCLLVGVFVLVVPLLCEQRELARRELCSQHLAAFGTGFQEYVDKQGHYPAVNTRVPVNHGWVVRLLPYMGQGAIYEKYDFSVAWSHPSNAEAIATPIAQFECPAAVYEDRMAVGTLPGNQQSYRGAVLDYLATNRVSPQVRESGFLPESTRVNGILSREGVCLPREIRDGTSCTTLMAEVAGTPAKYVFREKEAEPMYKKRGFGAWADGGTYFQGHGHQKNGKDWPGPCAVNCTNDDAVYSFHERGANVLYADGKVRFVNESLDIYILLAAITRDNGELLSADELGQSTAN